MNFKNKAAKDIFAQFIKFGIVGVSNTAVSYACYYLLLWLGCHYIPASIIAWFISVFNAFYWSKRYVFQCKNVWWHALLKTYASYGFSMLLGTVMLYVLVEFCGTNKYLAPFFTLLLTVPLNFVLNKYWTFRQEK